MQPATPFGPALSLLGGVHAGVVVLVVVLTLANVATRALAHRSHLAAARRGTDSLTPFPAHVTTTLALVLASYALAVLDPQTGLVLSALVVGLLLTDVVELGSRRREARSGTAIERPTGAIAVSVLVVGYVGSLVVSPVWNAVA